MLISRVRKLSLLCSVAALILAVSPAGAELCFNSSNCSPGELGGKPYCKRAKILVVEFFVGMCSDRGVCTADKDCKAPAECRLGTCQMPTSNCQPGEKCPGS